MKKIIFKFTIFLFSILWGMVITSLVYATVWPTTPVGEFVRWWITSILEKSLVNTWATTDGIVKKALDTVNLWSGVITSVSGNIWIWTATPSAKLDVIGKTQALNMRLVESTASGYIVASDGSGNTSWIPNNYRLKVSSLMVNGGTYGHQCYVMEDTSVQCLGYNGNWDLGIGNNTNNFYYPIKVPLKWVKKVYSNNLSLYALMLNGDMYVIGWYNAYWELWLWDTATRYVPQKITGVSNVVDFVTKGAYYTDGVTWRWAANACALLSDKTVKCWWRNGTGQLWNGDSTYRATPTQVYGLTNVKKVVMDEWQLRGTTCALLYDNTVKCWWYNWRGQLWNWDTNDRYVPTTVNISGVSDIEIAGSNQSWAHVCAIMNDATVKCWWWNGHGQIGNGNTSHQYNPVTVTGLSNVRKLVISWWSGYWTYAITNDNKVYSWGYNGYGELWHWDTTNRTTATLIPWLTNVKDVVSTGWNEVSTCALLFDGSVKCWGYNAWGQLWNWDTTNRSTPTLAVWVHNATEIEIYTTYRSNRIYTCAEIDDGSVKCWGYNGFGQLGQWNTLNYPTPVSVKNLNID